MAFSEGGPIRRITYFDDLTWSRPNSMHSLNGDGTKAVISTSANVGNQNPEGERDYLLSNQGF